MLVATMHPEPAEGTPEAIQWALDVRAGKRRLQDRLSKCEDGKGPLYELAVRWMASCDAADMRLNSPSNIENAPPPKFKFGLHENPRESGLGLSPIPPYLVGLANCGKWLRDVSWGSRRISWRNSNPNKMGFLEIAASRGRLVGEVLSYNTRRLVKWARIQPTFVTLNHRPKTLFEAAGINFGPPNKKLRLLQWPTPIGFFAHGAIFQWISRFRPFRRGFGAAPRLGIYTTPWQGFPAVQPYTMAKAL